MSGATINPDRRWPRWLRLLFTGLIFVSLLAAAAAGVAMILFDGFDQGDFAASLVITPVLTMVYSCLALINVHAMQRRRFVPAALIAMGLLTVGFAIWIWAFTAGISMSRGQVEPVVRWGGTFTVPAVMLTLAVRFVLLETAVSVLRLSVLGMAANLVVLGGISVMLMWSDWWHPLDAEIGLVLTGWIVVTMIGLLGIPMAIRLGALRKPPRQESIPSRLMIDLTCPGCGSEQTLPTGVTACGACRFALVIEVEEPRCECGYLLYRLQGDMCPECGAVVPESARWVAETPTPGPAPPATSSS